MSNWRIALSSKELSDKQLEDLNNCLDIQGRHGNWDYDDYMHGMFNGMELMDSIVDSREPMFKDAPKAKAKASLKLSWEEHDIVYSIEELLKEAKPGQVWEAPINESFPQEDDPHFLHILSPLKIDNKGYIDSSSKQYTYVELDLNSACWGFEDVLAKSNVCVVHSTFFPMRLVKENVISSLKLSWEEDRGQIRRKFQIGDIAILKSRYIFPVANELQNKQVEIIDYNSRKFETSLILPGGVIRTSYCVKVLDDNNSNQILWVHSYNLEPIQEFLQSSLKLSWVDYPRRKLQIGDNVIIRGAAFHFYVRKELRGKKGIVEGYNPNKTQSIKTPYLVRVLEGVETGNSIWLPSDALTFVDEDNTSLTEANLKLSWEEYKFKVGDSVKILSKSIGNVSNWQNFIGKKGQINRVIYGAQLDKFLKKVNNTKHWEIPVPEGVDRIYVVMSAIGISYFLAQDLEPIPRYTLSWMEDPPNNPNKTSIEAMEEFLKPSGVFVRSYNDLITLLDKYSIVAYHTVLEALKSYEQSPLFKGYYIEYLSPYHKGEDKFITISMVRLSNKGDINIIDSPLRIY